MNLVAGVDSSTQSTKVLLCRADDGSVVAEAAAPHPDGTECPPDRWWEALTSAGRDLLERADAVGVAAQQHGMVVLDDDGEVIRPAMLWNNVKSAPQARALVDELGGPAEWAARTGSVPTMSFTVTKLRWLAENEPDNARRVRRVLLPHDWLTWRLAGGGPAPAGDPSREPTTDRGDASGTGYFSLNLLQLGAIESLTATDISAGMLKRLAATGKGLGLEVETAQTEAEELPFEDESFDLVFGHAVLHHIPDLDRAFAEFRRVLRPGGAIAFAGEPSRYGDRLAALPKRTGLLVAPVWRRLVRAQPRAVAETEQSEGHSLEGEVDVHAFAPADLRKLLASAGFENRRVGGEELLANAWGWGLRTVESTAEPESISFGWRRFAFNSYIALQKVDTRLLEPNLPAELFYNLLVSGSKPV